MNFKDIAKTALIAIVAVSIVAYLAQLNSSVKSGLNTLAGGGSFWG